MGNFIDLGFIAKSIPQMLVYLPVTIRLAIIPMIFGTLIGLIVALIKIYKVPVLKQLAFIYVSLIRGTPLLVQLYIVYYGLFKVLLMLKDNYSWLQNIDVNAVQPEYYAIFAFSINLGAYLSETLRSAIESVDRGQFEAAHAMGMRQSQIMLKIILPQASLVALPNLGNTLISMVKDTSFAFMIMVVDIMGEAKILGARGLRFFEVYVGVSIIYWVVCIILERCLVLLERKLKVYERGIAE